jgi:hypothetical protein
VTDIATLPAPKPDRRAGYPRSAVTGRPRRPVVALLAGACWAAAMAWEVLTYARLWWTAHTVTGLPDAARLFAWFEPEPVSGLAVGLVIATGAILVLVVAAAGAIAYNAWQGKRWTRWGGLVALAVTGLTYLLHPLAIWALAPAALAAALLWLPPFKHFCDAIAPAPRPTGRLPLDATPVAYGPQQLIGN